MDLEEGKGIVFCVIFVAFEFLNLHMLSVLFCIFLSYHQSCYCLLE